MAETPLRVLQVEDSPDDAELVLRALRKGGFAPEATRVDTAGEYVRALEAGEWDVILSDSTMPRFSAASAFALLKSSNKDIPFILVSGRIGEENAVDLMRQGVRDYVPKDNFKRLAPVIERELREAEMRREGRAGMAALAETETRYRSLLESSIQGIFVQRGSTVVFANQAGAELLGYTNPEELMAAGGPSALIAPEDRERIMEYRKARLAGKSAPTRFEYRAIRKDGSTVWFDTSVSSVEWSGQPGVMGAIVDITHRKRAEESLRISEEHYRSLFENMLNAVVHCRMEYVKGIAHDFVFLSANRAFETVLGLKDVVGKKVSEVVPDFKEADPTLFAAYVRVAETGVPERFETHSEAVDQWLSFSVYSPEKGEFVVVLDNITDRKRAEEALRVSEEKHRTVLESSIQGVCVVSKTKTLFLNSALARMFGYTSPDEVLGIGSLYQHVADEDKERLISISRARLGDGSAPERYEFQAVTKDGRRIWCDTQATTILWEGQPAVLATIVDVTERRQALQQLEANERLLRTVFDTLPVHLVVKDAETRYLMVNRAWCERYGMTLEQVVGKTSSEISGRPQADKDLTIEHDRATLSGEKDLLIFEGWDQTAMGGVRHYQSIRAPIRDSEGRVTGLVGATVDLTEQKRAEERLRANERLLQTVFDTIPHMLVVKDTESRLLMVNKAWSETYGIAPEYAIHQPTLAMPNVPEEEKRVYVAEDRELFAQGAVNIVGERIITVKGGKKLPVYSIKAPLHDETGKIIGMVGAFVDLSDRVKAEERLRDNELLLRTVFDTLPHPLAVKDTESRYQIVNRAWVERYKIPRDQVVGKRLGEIRDIPQISAQRTDERDRSVLLGEGSDHNEEYLERVRTGLQRFVQSARTPIRDDAGQVTGLISMIFDIHDRKMAEEGLRASQRLLQTVFDTIPHALVVKDRDSRYLMVNKAWGHRYGIAPEAAVGKRITDFSEVGAIGAEVHERERRIFTGQVPVVMGEGQEITAGGKQAFYQSIKAPLRDESGEVSGLVGVIVDTTEIVHAGQEVRASQRLLQTVFDTIPHMVIVKDKESRYLMVNHSWSETYGIPAEKVLGKLTPEVEGRPKGDLEKIIADDRKVLSDGGATLAVEQEFTVKSGERRTYQSIKTPYRDEHGELAGIVGVLVDLTPEREAQRKADVAHARLYDAVESLPAAFYLYDNQERLVLWNSRVREFFPEMYHTLHEGMTFEEVLRGSMPQNDVPSGEEDAFIQARLAQFRDDPKPIELAMKEGRWIQALDRRTSDGGTVSLRFDISELKTQEQSLRQAQKMEAVGQLTGGVAHDFNNVLQVIAGYVELAANDLAPDHPAAISLKTADDATRRAADLTRQLLAFSRKQVLRPQNLDLTEVTRGITKLIGRLLPVNVVLEVKEGEAVEPVIADRGMIEQVLMNLAVNARDAMPDGGSIVVDVKPATFDREFCRRNRWAKPGTYTALRFTDTGMGMPPEVLERIFEPFFTTKELGKGTGLGLSTVYGIVQQHNGLIQVESQPGVGTTFWIYLPVRGEMGLEVADTVAGPVAGGIETILVAEDEQIVRKLLVSTLRSAGYTVLEAADGEEALALLSGKGNKRPALAVLDMTMPKMGGRDVFLRMREKQPELRVVFSSGWYSEAELNFLADQHHAFVYKPYTRDQLLRAVRRALDRPQARA